MHPEYLEDYVTIPEVVLWMICLHTKEGKDATHDRGFRVARALLIPKQVRLLCYYKRSIEIAPQ